MDFDSLIENKSGLGTAGIVVINKDQDIINILDPDCFVFGGGVSNEIDFLSEIETIVRKFVTGREYDGVFLKPKYGDASGVRGAARLGRSATY